LISPFDLPEPLGDNVRVVKDYGCPTRAAQLGLSHCKGRLIYHCVDDGIFLEGAIDRAIKVYNKECNVEDALMMPYREGKNYSGKDMPSNYWTSGTHADLRMPGIAPNWKTSAHFMMDLDHLLNFLGGFDCNFEYLVHPIHDLMFRIQANGDAVIQPPFSVQNCSHLPGIMGDHGPIHYAQIEHDAPIFYNIYKYRKAADNRIQLDKHAWKNCPEIWERRFNNKKPKEYKELYD